MMTRTTETYGIRPDYVPNRTALTIDEVSRSEYWDSRRIEEARYYQFSVYRRAAALMRREGLQTLVDVGCGVGMKLEWVHRELPLVRLIGIDQPRAIEFCRERHPFGEWYVDDFENQTTQVGAIKGDLVLCADVIEHVLDPDRLLQYLRERLTPGGWILISTPERDLVRGRDCLHSPNPAHVREWNKTEFGSYLCSRGFRILEHNLDFPVRESLNWFALQEAVAALLRGRSARYSQVCLVKPA